MRIPLPQAVEKKFLSQSGQLKGLQQALLRGHPAEHFYVKTVIRPRFGIQSGQPPSRRVDTPPNKLYHKNREREAGAVAGGPAMA